MFLGTNVNDLLKKKLGSPNSFLKKTRKTAIFRLFSVTIIRHSCHGNATFIRILLVCDTSYYSLVPRRYVLFYGLRGLCMGRVDQFDRFRCEAPGRIRFDFWSGLRFLERTQ